MNDLKVGEVDKHEKLKTEGIEGTEGAPTKKRKGPKEPNPLSMKKKKATNTDTKSNQDSKDNLEPKNKKKKENIRVLLKGPQFQRSLMPTLQIHLNLI